MSTETPCGIRHVHLSDSMPDLVPGTSQQSLMAVFWWQGIPLGRRIFSVGELPVPGPALAAIAASACAPALAAHGITPDEDAAKRLRDDTEVAAQNVAGPVSVIICTRNRPDALARCLDSISKSMPAPCEIIVVDNAPENRATRDVVSNRPGLRYVAEPRPGLSRARNAGLAAASGKILVFTDDDVEVAPHWLASLRAGFADPRVGCVTGLVLPAALDSDASFAFEVDWGGLAGSFRPARFDHALLEQPFGEAPPVWQVGAGANMALRRAVIDQIGPFDLRLGAGAAGCSEDSEFWHRALAAGWICRYQPLAVVFHHHRATVCELKTQMRAYMRGHVGALFVQFGQTRHPGNLLRIFVGLPYHFFKTGLRLFLSGSSVRRQVFPSELRGLLEAPFDWARRCRGPKYDSDSILVWAMENPMIQNGHLPDAGQVMKRPLGAFLADNPFPGKLTDGLYFRDKMRAIHRIAPDHVGRDLLEIGGGQSGLSKLLYPSAQVVNLDFDPTLADAPCNHQPGQRFVAGDATDLPFEASNFDVVTMFDLLEHVEDDTAVAREAMRVLRPGGVVLVTTPDTDRWRYPYFSVLRPICPDETELFARWGHVRRGYDQSRLDAMFGHSAEATGGFINGWLALNHDIAFSKLPRLARLGLHALAAPVSMIGWFGQHPGDPGTEIASRWRKEL